MSNQKTYVVIIDVNSLYPNIIVSHNISNETLYGVITNVNITNQKEYLYKLFDIKDDLDQQFFKNFAKGRFAGRIFAFLLYANMY
ncbi:MAG: DNA polymerase domain-containing protein, partial [bacterium]